MSIDVLGVHGIRNWRDATPESAAAALANRWAADLGRPAVAVAYYADQLRLRHHGATDDLDALDAVLRGRPRELLEAWLAELGWQEAVSHGRALTPLRQLASWAVMRFGADRATVLPFLARYLEEVTLYFDPDHPDRRSAIRTTVARAIHENAPRVVIAHSLGSVVTYETLWAYRQLNIELLITIGSPLALPTAVFPLLQPAPVNGKGARPPSARRWINIADPSDIVAIPRPLSTWFDGIAEEHDCPVGVGLTHASGAYLSSAVVRDIVSSHLEAT